MTKPQATLYWHTTYRTESNNVIRSSKRRLIMKLVMSWCHTHTHTHTHWHTRQSKLFPASVNSSVTSLLLWSERLNHQQLLFRVKTAQNKNQKKKDKFVLTDELNFSSVPQWQTTKLFTEAETFSSTSLKAAIRAQPQLTITTTSLSQSNDNNNNNNNNRWGSKQSEFKV